MQARGITRPLTAAERAALQELEAAERTVEAVALALECARERLTLVTRREVRRERQRHLRLVVKIPASRAGQVANRE